MSKTILYETRDGKGNPIIKEIQIKSFKESECECTCDICGEQITTGIKIKDAVSSNFTDWSFFSNGYVCQKCAELFSVYPYSYIYQPQKGIELMNVRQISRRLTALADISPPFMICLSTSQKKHLFYRATLNYSKENFAVNLETETIYTNCRRQAFLFDFVGNLQALLCTKDMLKQGKLSYEIPTSKSLEIYNLLWKELSQSREIQIPLFCSQKPEITKEEALCNLDSILMM